MALFTIFSYKRRPPASIPAVMDALTAAAHVQPSHVLRASLGGVRRPVHAHVLSTATAVYAADQQVDVGAGLTVVHGHPFRAAEGTGRPHALTAAEIAAGCAGGVDLVEVDRWAGEFALCHVDADGVLTAVSDLHRVQSVFYVDTPWVFAVSTRPSLLRLLAGDPGLDPEAIAAVAATGYALGDLTVHAGVRAVPQGRGLRWDGDAVALLSRDRVVAGPGDRGVDVGDAWTQGQLDAGIADAAASIELAAAAAGPDETGTVELGITGGKDSRVVLAMALARGLGPRLTLVTRGIETHPDVVVGRLLAERAGLPHRFVPPTEPPARLQEPTELAASYVDRLARHAFLTDGLVGGWDCFTGTRTGTGIELSGLMGEILKAFAKTPFDPGQRPDPATIVELQSPFDLLEVLRPGARQVLVDRLDQRNTELLDAGYTYADLPDLFYYENRIPNWLGHSKQVYTFTTTQVAPLGSVPLARLAFRATAAQRQAELVHHLIVERAAPELLDVPFALQTWDPSLPGAPVVDAVPMPPPTELWVRPHGSWQYAANHAEVRKALRLVVRETRHAAVWEAVDKAALLKRLNGPRLPMRKLMSVLGILTTALYADDRLDHTKIVAPGSAEPVTTYAFATPTPGPAWRPRDVLGRRGVGWRPV